PVLEERPHAAGGRAVRGVRVDGRGVDRRRPQLLPLVPRIAPLEHDTHGVLRPGEAERLVERAVRGARLGRGLPLAVDGREPARVEHRARLRMRDPEAVLAEVGVVDEASPAAGPRPVRHDAVQAHDLRATAACVEVVQAHGAAGEVRVEGRLTGRRLRRGVPGRGGGCEPWPCRGREREGEKRVDQSASHGCFLVGRVSDPAGAYPHPRAGFPGRTRGLWRRPPHLALIPLHLPYPAPTTALRRSTTTTSRQTPFISPIRSRSPTSRNPCLRTSARLAVFSGKMPPWSVQKPRRSDSAITAASSAEPTPRPRASSAT